MLLDPDSATAYSKAFATVVNAFAKLVRTVGKHFVSSALTVFLMLIGWGGIQSIQEGSFTEAIHVLMTSREERAKQESERKAALLQQELRAVSASNQLVQQTLQDLLIRNPGPVRVRTALIHNGTVTMTQRAVLKFDILAGVAVRGRAIGDLVVNRPLLSWTPYLPDLLEGRCVYRKIEALTDPTAVERLRDIGALAVLACPLNGRAGLIGAMFITWDTVADLPADPTAIMEAARDAAIRIGAAYEMRPLVTHGE